MYCIFLLYTTTRHRGVQQETPAYDADSAGCKNHKAQTKYDIAPHGCAHHTHTAEDRCHAVNQRGSRTGVATLLLQHDIGAEGSGNGSQQRKWRKTDPEQYRRPVSCQHEHSTANDIANKTDIGKFLFVHTCQKPHINHGADH